jgi:hypothetical protein
VEWELVCVYFSPEFFFRDFEALTSLSAFQIRTTIALRWSGRSSPSSDQCHLPCTGSLRFRLFRLFSLPLLPAAASSPSTNGLSHRRCSIPVDNASTVKYPSRFLFDLPRLDIASLASSSGRTGRRRIGTRKALLQNFRLLERRRSTQTRGGGHPFLRRISSPP